MRPLPRDPTPELTTSRATGWSKDVEVVLITRLFGGGSSPREIDERSWLRPPALKSALRFWWRAGHAHRFADLASLRAAEERLFGASARFAGNRIEGGPGLLSVEVESAPPGNLDKRQFVPGEGDALNIAYFGAAEQKRRGIEAAELAHPGRGDKAKLRLRLASAASADEREQLLDTLRLWLVLGGVGSRTRRGSGALAVTKEKAAGELGLPTSDAELKTFLLRWLRPTTPKEPIAGLWSLAHSQAVFIGKALDKGEAAQEKLLEVLRDFRQQRRHPSNWKGPAGWGQSRWPEGDALRLREGVAPDWRHQPKPEHAERFPRVALGMPIVMHFKDEGRGQDPSDHSLSAALPNGDGWSRLNRFASPLVLRPVQFWVKGTPAFLPVAWVGPYTLPSDTRPLAEPTAGGPPATVSALHVAKDFDLDAAANTLYTDLIAAFGRAGGFTRLT